MNNKIEAYILSNKVFSLATSVDNIPYCANCFYSYDEVIKTLIFLSDPETRHIKEALINNRVGGSIQNGVTEVEKLQGIQFMGVFIKPSEELAKDFYAIYFKRFPFAKAKPSPIWGIQLNWIKMTDNTLEFGKKLIWEK